MLHWGDSRGEIIERFRGQIPDDALQPKSVTFISAKLTDNPALMTRDPGYMANLLAQPKVERERLLGGNWKIRPAAGLYFLRSWLKPAPVVPWNAIVCRGYDIAGTEKTDDNDPSWTESVKMARDPEGRIFILDHTFLRGSPAQVEKHIRQNAETDGKNVMIGLPQDPGQAGKAQAAAFTRLLSGWNLKITTESRGPDNAPTTAPSTVSSKVLRFGPFSAQAEAGNVFYIPGDWNAPFFERLEAFPEAKHKDTADATSRAFNTLSENTYDSSMSWVG